MWELSVRRHGHFLFSGNRNSRAAWRLVGGPPRLAVALHHGLGFEPDQYAWVFTIRSRFGLHFGYDSADDPGVGWSIFQAPNLSAIFSAVEPRHVGAVSGISLTSANIANAMGVAIGSVLFLRWLNYYGLDQAGVPPYTQWGENPAVFIRAFQNSWMIIAGLTVIAIVASSMRGIDKRQRLGP